MKRDWHGFDDRMATPKQPHVGPRERLLIAHADIITRHICLRDQDTQ
jgi:hypothetical protein